MTKQTLLGDVPVPPWAPPPRPVVYVWGCGSIGARRAQLLRDIGCEVLTWDVDAVRAAREGRATPPAVALAMRGLGAAFICTPADAHVGPALQAVEAGVPAVDRKSVV